MRYLIKNATLVNEGKSFMASVVISGDTIEKIIPTESLQDNESTSLQDYRNHEVIDAKGKPFNKRKATTDHWYNVAIGSSEASISIDLVNKEHKIRVSLWINDNKDIFDALLQRKEDIE